jgi:DNA-binding NarL/FixJ family response regulator
VIRVLLADDQTLVRQGVRSLLDLSPDIRVVAEAGDGEEALRLVAEAKPDVLLLDVRMPKKDGIAVLTALGGTPPAILLTTFDDDEALLAGAKAGAKGFLLKDVSLEALTAAIRAVAQGGSVLQPAIGERVLRGLEQLRPRFPASPLPEALTARETEVLRLLAGGYSNREIARALGAAEGTIKNHASSIFSKLGVRDRTRAVLKAVELGLL